MNVTFREIERNDLQEITKWRNDKSLIDLLGSPFRYINSEVDQFWFDNYLKDRANNVRLAIYCEEKKIVIGAVYLTNIDWISRSSELSIWIGNSDYQGKGIGKMAVQVILKHAFQNLNLYRVYLTLLRTNNRAKKLYVSSGFMSEGVQRSAIYKNGSYYDVEMMSILKVEYDAP